MHDQVKPIDSGRRFAGSPGAARYEGTTSTEEPWVVRWWNCICQRLLLIAIITFFGTTLGLGVALLSSPRYTAVAVLNVDPRKSQWTSIKAPVSDLPAERNSLWGVIWAEVARIASWPVVLNVIDDLNLDADAPFRDLGPGMLDRIAGWILGVRTEVPSVAAGALPSGVTGGAEIEQPDRIPESNIDRMRLAKAFEKQSRVWADRSTGLIYVSFTSDVPTRAAEVVNRWVEIYQRRQIQGKSDEVRRAIAWLNGHIAAQRAATEASDAAVEAYKAKAGLASIGEGNVATERIKFINEELSVALAEMTDLSSRISQTQHVAADPSRVHASSHLLKSEIVEMLQLRLAEGSAKLTDLRTRLGDHHPEVMAILGQQSAYTSALAGEMLRILGQLVSRRDALEEKISNLREQLEDAERSLASLSSSEGRARQLQSEAQTNREIYNSFLLRVKELTTQLAEQPPDTAVISMASIPADASYPPRKFIVLGSFFASFGVALLVAAVAEAAKQGFDSPDQLEAHLGTRVVGVVPSTSPTGWRALLNRKNTAGFPLKSEGPYSEMLQKLLVHLLELDPNKEYPQVFMVASAVPSEGKTTTAVTLARLCALAGRRTLLVDADLGEPSLHRIFGRANEIGIVNVLGGEVSLAQAIQKHPEFSSGAHLLLAGSSNRPLLQLIAHEKLHSFIQQARTSYDVVIIDTPPVISSLIPASLTSYVDATLLLVRWRHTSRSTAVAAANILQNQSASQVVAALSQVDLKEPLYRSRERQCRPSGRSWKDLFRTST